MEINRYKKYIGHVAVGILIGIVGSLLIDVAHAGCDCSLKFELLELDSIESMTNGKDIDSEETIWSGRKVAIGATITINYEFDTHDGVLYVQYSGEEDRKYTFIRLTSYE